MRVSVGGAGRSHRTAGDTAIERTGNCFENYLAAFIFLVVGAGLSFWGWNILQNAKASTSWPTAQGQIIKSEVTRSRDGEGHDSYSPEVTYTYLAKKRAYKSYAIKFGENSYDNKSMSEKIAAAYPVGKKVSVYYNPEDPDNSVLEQGVTIGSYIVLGIGVLFVAIGLFVPPIAFFFRGHS